MEHLEIIAQGFGIVALIFSILSFQEKDNKKFFIKQGVAGLLFFINFAMIGAISAALFNITNLVRSVMFSQKEKRVWKLVAVAGLYTVCFVLSLRLIMDDPFQIVLSALTYLTLEIMTVLMWLGNGKHIRYGQFFASSPS